MNPYTDKYFTKSRLVAQMSGLNPVVKYRVFGRFYGVAALEPAKYLIAAQQLPDVKISILPTGTQFNPGDTLMIIEGRFQDIVELETMYLQWVALPCYCAGKARAIVDAAKGRMIMDFAARHMYGAESVALASYGAEVGGIKAHSTDVGANSLEWLHRLANWIAARDYQLGYPAFEFRNKGIGTTPHALLAIFHGDYLKMADAYLKVYPDDFVALIDYNNREIDDTIALVKHCGPALKGVRTDTCGENCAQVIGGKAQLPGVCTEAVEQLRDALDLNGGEKVKLYVSSGFDEEKVERFVGGIGVSFDGIGTGSFIPKAPQCTSDIFEVSGQRESKVGREWGYERNEKFWKLVDKGRF